uniref:Mediator of RNA polymerase II transcription subunit 18 n=4 Tax=Corvoidea TaxID=192204 RepID=A0A8C3EJQ6_CORMO
MAPERDTPQPPPAAWSRGHPQCKEVLHHAERRRKKRRFLPSGPVLRLRNAPRACGAGRPQAALQRRPQRRTGPAEPPGGAAAALPAARRLLPRSAAAAAAAAEAAEPVRERTMEAPPVTMMPVTGGTINMMEYLLQGSVLDQSLESLLHRLRGLCDNMEPETFLDHEMVFLLKGQQASPFVLRARRSMDKNGMPWHLRYLGQPEIGDKNRHALVRNCVDIATSDNLTDFLVEMGFRMDHEFVAKGHVFRKGIMKIVVYKIFRILMPGNTESIEPLSLSYLVELNVVAPAGQDIVSDDMRNFAEQLKPLVHLEKIDPKRLM